MYFTDPGHLCHLAVTVLTFSFQNQDYLFNNVVPTTAYRAGLIRYLQRKQSVLCTQLQRTGTTGADLQNSVKL